MIQPCVYGIVFFAGMCGDECLRVNEAQPKTVPPPSNLYCAVSARPPPSPLAHLERYEISCYVYTEHQHGKRAGGEREGGCGPVVFHVTEMHNVRHHHSSHCWAYTKHAAHSSSTNQPTTSSFFFFGLFFVRTGFLPCRFLFIYLVVIFRRCDNR